MKNQSVTSKNHKYPPGTTKNQRGTLKNPKNPPGTMKNQPGTLENHKQWPRTMNDHKNPPGPMKNQPKPLKTDMEPWKTNPNCEKPWKPTWSCTGWLRVITGGYRRLPGGSDHFSWHTDKHCIIIYISSSPSSPSSSSPSSLSPSSPKLLPSPNLTRY